LRKIRLVLWLLIATAAAVAGAQVVLRTMETDSTMPTAEEQTRTANEVARDVITGEFSLIDHHGKPVTDMDYRGSWPLIFFGYTHCPDVCPTALGVVALVMDELGPDADKVQPLFITVDPARDTPEIMSEFVAAFHPRIIGLSGSAKQVKAAAQSHRAYYAKAPAVEGMEEVVGEYAMDHSAYLYLMDPEGVYAHVFSPTDTAEEITAEIRSFVKQRN
jgi:cytochrome oxidase Cu insertion factor (SCO1/SenC/PrrC family)